MLRGILHRSVRVVPITRTDARYIPTGKPVELREQKLAAKRLPRKRYCTACDLSTIKNIGGTVQYLFLGSPCKKDQFPICIFLVHVLLDTSEHVSMLSQLPTPERLNRERARSLRPGTVRYWKFAQGGRGHRFGRFAILLIMFPVVP